MIQSEAEGCILSGFLRVQGNRVKMSVSIRHIHSWPWVDSGLGKPFQLTFVM